jgi:hypothetical protein
MERMDEREREWRVALKTTEASMHELQVCLSFGLICLLVVTVLLPMFVFSLRV